MRAALTTKDGKAKCLAYRNGHRCGQVARHEVTYWIGRYFRHLATCDDCLTNLRLLEAGHDIREFEVRQTSVDGFSVKMLGPCAALTREYIPMKGGS